ncbi:hypothetical protein RJ498_003782 [Pluralibacter gergoviae]
MSIRKTFAIDSSLSIENAVITFNDNDISLIDYIPEYFKGKVVVNFERVSNISESFVCLKSDYNSILNVDLLTQFSIKFKTIENGINNFYDVEYEVSENGRRKLAVFTSTDTPYITKDNVPESKVDLVEMAKIINIYVVIYKFGDRIFNKNNHQIFDSYSALGFVIVDINEFDRYVSINAGSNDLINEFTTTELANDLFEEGLMVLSWGNTPWVYYINSLEDNDIDASMGESKSYCGTYKLKRILEHKYLVIPGNELRDWKLCKKKKWPELEIEGKGEYVEIRLYVNKAYTQSDEDYPIPTFHISRMEHGEVNPLLQSSIFD